MLTDILNTFVHSLTLGHDSINVHTNTLLRYFVLYDLVMFGLYMAMSGGDFLKEGVRKIMVIGMFQFVVSQWGMLTTAAMKSFVKLGLIAGAGGGESMRVEDFLDPSAYVVHGLKTVEVVFQKFSIIDLITSGILDLVLVLTAIGILAVFILIGLQVFLTVLEFYIVTSLAVVLIPFGLFKPTAFLADRAIGSTFAACVKLMVLALVTTICRPMLMNLKLEGTFVLYDLIVLLASVVALGLVMRKAPTLATSMASGSSNLDLGPVFSNAVRAVGTGISMAGGGLRIAHTGAQLSNMVSRSKAAESASKMGGGGASGNSNAVASASKTGSGSSAAGSPGQTSQASSAKNNIGSSL